MTLVVNTSLFGGYRKNSRLDLLFFIPLSTILLLSLGACQPQEPERYLSGPTMGTDYRITLIGPSSADVKPLKQAIDGILESINESMSTYLPDSELSIINGSRVGHSSALSDPLNFVLTRSVEISKDTDGYFDVTLGALINLWGFGSQQSNSQPPSDQEIENILAEVGYKKLRLRDQSLQINGKSVYIDLSAIAKGYAVDRVHEFLLSKGVGSFLIEIGGEIRTHGMNNQGVAWRIGIERPQLLFGVSRTVDLSNKAIATSGDYRNYIDRNDKRYSHIIDHRTGKPKENSVASVSVIAEDTLSADAYATALLAMGKEKGLVFAQNRALPVYFLTREQGEFVESYTSDFAKYMTLMR